MCAFYQQLSLRRAKMGDDAEYYIEQQEEERQYEDGLRQAREDQITQERIKRERVVKSKSDNSLAQNN